MPRKILIFNSGSSIYGAERGLINLVNALKDEFEITVVLPHRGILEEKIKVIFPSVKIKIFPLPILAFSFSPYYYIKYIFLTLLSILYFGCYVIFKKIDLLCTNSLLLCFSVITAKLTRRRHIWYIREFFTFKPVNLFLGILLNKLSDGIICQSEAIKEKFFLDDKTVVIYEPINTQDYKIYDMYSARKDLNLPLDAIIIGVISRIHPLKGQYEFLKEMKSFLKYYKDVYIVIVGDISFGNIRDILYKRKISKLIHKEGLDNVILLGFRSDIDKLLSLCDACVFPFKREEPFGIAVEEAMVFSKICFFPFIGGLKEIHEIFKRGQEYNIKNLTDTIIELRQKRQCRIEGLDIPDIISFERYKSNIISYFKAKL